MKTMAGGNRQDLAKYKRKGISLPQAKLKWVLENKYVASALSELLTFDILEENLAVCGAPLSPKEKMALLNHVTSFSAKYCQMCGQCMKECPINIAVPDILRYALYYTDHGKTSLAKKKYKMLAAESRYNNCNYCGHCLKACPSSLPIIQLLQSAHQVLV